MSGNIYIAKTTAIFEFEGRRVIVHKNKTTVREGHPLLKEFPGLFELLHVDYEVADAPPAPAPAPAPAPPKARVEEATNDPERPRSPRPAPRPAPGKVNKED